VLSDAHEDRLVIDVVDDGVGISETASEGFGLAGMQERAAMVGGRVTVEPAESGGTRVRFVAPL
jgi:signal transduction histidine kinase